MAGAGKKTFTAGEVLTASDVNTYLMEQSVMNFAGTAARASAIPTPTDGMVTYNQSNDQIEAYNGSAWIGIGGLQLVKTQTIGTGVTSVTVTGAFSATYDAYKIIIAGATSLGGDYGYIKFGAANTNYNIGVFGQNYAGGTSSANVSSGTAATFAWYIDGNQVSCNIDIINPFLTEYTVFTTVLAGPSGSLSGSGVHKTATSYSDFTIGLNSGTGITGGTIYVYGYAKG